MEFEADRDATRCVVDVFFNHVIAARVAEHHDDNHAVWLLRLILGGINSVFVILQNARILNISSDPGKIDGANPFDSHPTPRSRITTIYASLFERLEEKNWQEVMEMTEYDFHERDLLLKVLIDSFEDLNTIAGIFSRESNSENTVASWEETIRPVFKGQKILHALDHRDDVIKVAELFYKKIFVASDHFSFFDNPSQKNRMKELEELWFDEYENDLLPYLGRIESGFLRENR